MSFRLTIFFLIALTFYSCRSNGRMSLANGKKSKVILECYTDEPIYVKNFIFFNDSSYQFKKFNSDKTKGQDSIFSLFKNALNNLNLKMEYIEPKQNVVDKAFFLNDGQGTIKGKNIKREELLDLIINSDSIFLFPIIHVFTSRYYSITGGYTFSYRTYGGVDFMKLIIYMVKKENIIYNREIYLSRPHISDPIDEFKWQSQMKPEYWDLIVQKAMEDYIKRIRK